MPRYRAGLSNQVVLVVGGAGFIGSHLVDSLITCKAKEIIILDNLFLGSEDNISQALNSKLVHFYNDDAEFSSSLGYIFDRHQVDVVFNCATKALNYSFINPSNAFSTNVKVILNLLELQRKGHFKSLCHFSTSEVYGTAVYEPMDEQHPTKPTTTYAAGKSAADMALESYVNMFDLDSFIVRPFNNYGPRQNYKGSLAGIIPLTIARILQGIPPEIHGTGHQSRDFIHVSNTVDAVINLYEVMKPAQSVNISTDNQVSVSVLINKICKLMNYEGEIISKPRRAADVECHKASNELIKSLISYQLTPFEEGLEETVRWYNENIKI